MNQGKMMPIGPLMIEHRRIERMIEVMKAELAEAREKQKVDHDLVVEIVDFIRMYADRCHHGKEEDILFRDAKNKPLPPELAQTMQDLIDEHVWARSMTKQLVEANEKNRQGDQAALEVVIESMEKLVDFYPRHIEKEDRHFFIPLMEHFSQQEQDDMLDEENQFDQGLIHEKYEQMVKKDEARFGLD